MPVKILAVGAHPDDIEFGCAAVLIREIQRGHAVKILVLSRGEAGTNGTPAEREAESRAAARLIGAEVDFLDFGGDCHIAYAVANVVTMGQAIRQLQPTIVLAPSLEENQHPDHASVGKIVRDAARFARYGGLAELRSLPPHAITALYFYSITRTVARRPDIIVDVSDVVDRWEAAMRCHASQLQTKRHYIELRLALAHALGLSVGVQFAVGLSANDPLHVEALSDLGRSSRHF